MKDYSKIAWVAALGLLVFVLSSFDVSLVFGSYHIHLGWVHRLLPLMLVAWVVWLISQRGCCSCWSRFSKHEADSAENAPNEAAAD